ncbi:MAG: HIT family protein, partial [Nanoarchaeota archaeon]
MNNLVNNQANDTDNCIFCQIVSKKIPSKIVYEDKLVICILDINPANKGHVLLLTKKHYSLMMQVPDNELSHLFIISKKISFALLKLFNVDGTNIFIANGSIAGQKAPHFMMHIFPRFENDEIDFNLNKQNIDKNKLNEAFINIKKNISKNFNLVSNNSNNTLNTNNEKSNNNHINTNTANANNNINNNNNNNNKASNEAIKTNKKNINNSSNNNTSNQEINKN